MYGKSYESMYDGSMVGAGVHVFAVWNYIITKARRGYIEINPKLLAFTLGGKDQDPKEIEDALEFLCSPDPISRSPIEEGRRLVKEGPFLYRVVNWAAYNEIYNEEARREYNRHAQAKHRMLKRKQQRNLRLSPGEAAYLAAEAAGASQEVLDQMTEPQAESEGA